MSTLVKLADGLWVADAPLRFFGLHLGTRMTVVRRPDGGLIVHSPIQLDAGLGSQVDPLGPVRCIIAPNRYHHLFAGEWSAAYPGAHVVGARGLETKRKDLRFDAMLGDEPDASWADTLQHVVMHGSLLGETVFFHPPSRTVVSSDLVENFATSDHWPTRWYLKASRIHGKPGVGLPLRLMYRDHTKVRAAIDRLLAWDFDRVVIAHGDVIETNGRDVVRDSYSWL